MSGIPEDFEELEAMQRAREELRTEEATKRRQRSATKVELRVMEGRLRMMDLDIRNMTYCLTGKCTERSES